RIKVYTERGNDAFPLSELQAAVLVPQLAQLNERNRLRRANVDRILAETAKYGALQPVKICPQTQPSFYKLAWLLSGALARPICSRDMFLAAAQANRIPLAAGFRGFTQRSARRCRAAGDLHYSAVAASQTVVLHHPVLLAGDEEVEQMIARLVELLDRTQ
ncbi:MAG: DegT/DnrJ/EryC1/StrS family aminotransferase, partial [Candidatus Hydrogenedentales bacterium]